MPEPTTPPAPTPDEGRTFTQADVDKIVADRIARERAKFSDYDDLKTKAGRLDELETASKSEAEKAAQRAADAEKKWQDAEARALRLEVATSKGLSAAQAKRLTGSSREELEADADELLDTFKPPTEEPKPAPPAGAPREALRPGAAPVEPAPTKEELRKAIAEIPR
jgi:hypothetical protein